MNKSTIIREVYHSAHFRTPLGGELASGLWCDRIGEGYSSNINVMSATKLRILGLYAAIGIISGQGCYKNPVCGQIQVHAGDVIFVRPEEPCAYWSEGEWHECFIVWDGPDAARMADILIPRQNFNSNLRPQAINAVKTAYESLMPLMVREDIAAAFFRRIVIEKLLLDLSRFTECPRTSTMPTAVNRALELLSRRETINQADSLAAIARKCGYSLTHFRRIFKQWTGRSPKEYAASIRLNYAKEMLRDGLELKETAEACGFADVFHFMRNFKKATGMTAGNYAKSCSRQ